MATAVTAATAAPSGDGILAAFDAKKSARPAAPELIDTQAPWTVPAAPKPKAAPATPAAAATAAAAAAAAAGLPTVQSTVPIHSSSIVPPPPIADRIPDSGSFRLADMDWIGFDLDHTLARYKHERVQYLIYDSLVEYLIKFKHYPASTFSRPYDPHFVTKGVVLDKELGNFLVLDDQKHVVHARGFHGTKPIHFSPADDAVTAVTQHIYAGPQSEFDRSATDSDLADKHIDRWHAFLTYFDLPSGWVIAQLIDYFDANNGVLPQADTKSAGAEVQAWAVPKKRTNEAKYEAVFGAVIQAYQYNFANFNTGTYFKSFRADVGQYIYRRPDVRKWLTALRASGRKLFLITNSYYDYADLLLTHMFGTDWESLFDINMVNAKKPKFFSHPNTSRFRAGDRKQPYVEGAVCDASTLITDWKEKTPSGGAVYTHGNWRQLNEAFAAISGRSLSPTAGTNRLKVLYFGDNLKTDVMAIRLYSDWYPAAIVEELDESWTEYEHRIANPTAFTPAAATATASAATAKAGTTEESYEPVPSSVFWGSFFAAGPPSTAASVVPSSYWHRFTMLHSVLTVSDVAVLAAVNPNTHVFSYKTGGPESYYPAVPTPPASAVAATASAAKPSRYWLYVGAAAVATVAAVAGIVWFRSKRAASAPSTK